MEPIALPRPRTSTSAICSLICGLLGCIPFLPGLAAVILGIVGIRKTRDPMVTGRVLAIIGLSLGGLSLVGWGIVVATIPGGLILAYRAAEPARATAEQFARDLSEGRLDAAQDSSVEGTDRAFLIATGERMKPWGRFQSLGMNSMNIQVTNGKTVCQLGGLAAFADATRSYTATLHKEGETYKVAKFDFE